MYTNIINVNYKSLQFYFYQISMETTNRSRIRCQSHPNQQITNYCSNFNCLRPLCPDCVQIHIKSHNTQEIQSWKNCVNKSTKNIRYTLNRLKQILNRGCFGTPSRSLQAIESEAIKKLHKIKRQVQEMIDDIFGYHEKEIKNIIKKEFSYSPIDHSKLKLAIEQLQKLSLKMGTTHTVVQALKKSILLDHQALINHFEQQYKYMPARSVKEQFSFNFDSECLSKARKYLQNVISYENQNHKQDQLQYQSPRQVKIPRNNILIDYENYFKGTTTNKLLHFFIPYTNQLKVLLISNINQPGKWKTIKLNIKNMIPTFHKSIITPNGQIYITGGSQDNQKLRSIYRFNQQSTSLQLVANMINPRSSHSICYLNNNLYILGGFKIDNEVYKQCEVFNIETKRCKSIASLTHPSANGSSNSFNNQYIFKFGGVHNKIASSNFIEMYTISKNQWIVVDPQLQEFTERFWLLSFSACIQINSKQIFVFGGYNDSQDQASSNLTYTLYVEQSENNRRFLLRNINSYPLPEAEGFWNNNPIIQDNKIYALQNITDTDQVSSLIDDRRIIIFNGKKWTTLIN